MPLARCGVCGNPVRLRRVLRDLLKREEKTYPATMPDGSRQEFPVQWLCGGCEERAERHRQQRKSKAK